MADDNINVRFGATVDGAISGINQVTQKLEAFGANVEGLTGPLMALGEAAAAAFAVEAIRHFVEGITDLGVQIERTSQQLGISTEMVGELNAAAKFTDTSLENMRNSMARFDVNMQAAAHGTGNAAAAFDALGISVRNSSGHIKDSQELIGEISEKFKESADNGNKTAIAMALFGRQGKDLIPILDMGAAGMEHMNDIAKETGTLFSKNLVEAMHSTHDKIVEFDLAEQGLKNTLFLLLKPAFDSVQTAATKFAEGLNDAINHSYSFRTSLQAVINVIDIIIQSFSMMKTAFEQTAMYIEQGAAALTVKFTTLGQVIKDSLTGNFAQIKVDVKAGNDAITALNEEFHQKNLIYAQEYKNSMSKIYHDMTDDLNKPQATPEEVAKKHGLDDLGDHEGKAAAMNADIEAHKKMLDEEISMVGDNLQARMILQQQYFDWLKSKYPQDVNAMADAGRKIAQTQEQEVKKSEASWGRFFSSFNSGLMGMLHGTQTWRQGLSSMFFSVVELGIKAIEKMAAHWIASEVVKTAATNAGNAARLASTTASAAAGAAAKKAMDSSTVMADAKVAAAGAYKAVVGIPIIGPILAPPAAALAFGAVAAFDSFEVGTPYVPRTGPYILHEGEEVRPAGVRNAGGGDGGGGEMHVHISAIDSRDVARFFKNNSSALTDAIKHSARNLKKGTTK